MIKNGSLVFVPETEEFGIVTVQANKMSLVENPGKITIGWKDDENLIPIFEGLPPDVPVADIISSNIVTTLRKIAGFLWKENREMKNRIQQLEAMVKNHHQDETLHPELILSISHKYTDIPA